MENNKNNTCMYCFADTGGAAKCPACGGDVNAPVSADHLRPGTVLADKWLIGRAIGQDADGIVYVAMNLKSSSKVRVREYFPRDCAQRMPDGTVQIVPGAESRFNEGMAALRENAVSGEKKLPCFEANGTVYVAQSRKKAAESYEEEAEPDTAKKQIFIFGGIVVAVVLIILLIVAIAGRRAAGNINAPDSKFTLAPVDIVTLEPTEIPEEDPFVSETDDPLSWLDDLPTKDPNAMDWQKQSGTGDNTTDDYYSKYQDIVDSKTTKKPSATYAPDSVNPSSSKAEIKALQWRLIELGWLDKTTADGSYDTDTRYAVAYFQAHIRDNYNAAVKANGYADAETMKWLNDIDAPVNPDKKATGKPTSKPSPTPSIPESIDADSEPALIFEMQERLAELGWMDENDVNSKYDKNTKYAVAYFQKALKEMKLDIKATGSADKVTLQWLFDEDAPRANNATPAPTAAVTPVPAPTAINPDSAEADIFELQHRLSELGWLDGSLVNGKYTKDTRYAVAYFQKALKDLGIDVKATGYADSITLDWLFDDDAPRAASETPVPTAEPTVAPTKAPESGTINDKSSPERIKALQDRLYELGWLEDLSDADGAYNQQTVAAVSDFQGKLIELYGEDVFAGVKEFEQGYADELTQEHLAKDDAPRAEREAVYLYRIDRYYFPVVDGKMAKPYDHYEKGEVLTTTDNYMTIDAPGSEYEGYLFDAENQYNITSIMFEDTAKEYAFRLIYLPESYFAPDETPGPTEEPTPVPTEEPTPVPTEEPTPEPTEEPTPEPTEEPTPEPTEEPTPEPKEYKYHIEYYYFPRVNGAMGKQPDHDTRTDTYTTTDAYIEIEVPEPEFEGYEFDEGNKYNILSLEFTDTDTDHTLRVIYLGIEPDEYSYRIDRYYYTSVDGVMQSDPDYIDNGEVQSTTDTSLEIDIPSSSREGYVYYEADDRNTTYLEFSDTEEVYVFSVIYLNETYTPEPDPKYSYRVDRYYFTAVDGQLQGEPDFAEQGTVETTTETSMTVYAPDSEYDGYEFDEGNGKNVSYIEFTDTDTVYKFRFIYVNNTYTPEPDPEYSYRIDRYYFTAVDGQLQGEPDFAEKGEVITTTDTGMYIDDTYSGYDGYEFDEYNDKNIISLDFSESDKVYVFRLIFVKYTSSPEPTPEPHYDEPEAEPVIDEETVGYLTDSYREAYPDAPDTSLSDVIKWIQKVLVKSDTEFGTSYFYEGYEPTGVYDQDTFNAIYTLQMENIESFEYLDEADYGIVTAETFDLITAIRAMF